MARFRETKKALWYEMPDINCIVTKVAARSCLFRLDQSYGDIKREERYSVNERARKSKQKR